MPDTVPNTPTMPAAPTECATIAATVTAWLTAWQRQDYSAMARWTQPSWRLVGRDTAAELARLYAPRVLRTAEVLRIAQEDAVFARACCRLEVACRTAAPTAVELTIVLTCEQGRWGVYPL